MLCWRVSINSTQAFDQEKIMGEAEVMFCEFYCLHDSFSAYIYNLFFIYRSVTLLIFVFLLLVSKEKSDCQWVYRHDLSQWQRQPSQIPRV